MKPQPRAQDRQARRGGRLGPAGLACAQQLARAGHVVTCSRRADRIGGLLRYGIPDFKMEKAADRPAHRADAARKASSSGRACSAWQPGRGVIKTTGIAELPPSSTRWCCRRRGAAARSADPRAASSTACTSRWSSCRCRTSASPATPACRDLRATDKHVVIIGGGDTGSDCVGTSNRHGAESVTQFELLPKPPDSGEQAGLAVLAVEAAHVVLARRRAEPRLVGRDEAVQWRDGKVARSLRAVVEWKDGKPSEDAGCRTPSSRCRPIWCCSRWASVSRCRPARQLGVEYDARGNVKADGTPTTTGPRCRRSSPRATCGAASRWSSGRSAKAASARAVDEFLMGLLRLAEIGLRQARRDRLISARAQGPGFGRGFGSVMHPCAFVSIQSPDRTRIRAGEARLGAEKCFAHCFPGHRGCPMRATT